MMETLRRYVSTYLNRRLRGGAWRPDRSILFVALQSYVFSTIPVTVKAKSGGSIQHYYHFLFDLLLPIDVLFNRYRGSYIIALPDCGPFNVI